MRVGVTPLLTRYARTTSARAWERRRFVAAEPVPSVYPAISIRIEIAGYTDGTGSAATNLRLSQARAEVVRAYLVSRGVSPTRMIARGYGASNPIAVNTTPEGRAQNRRVELHQLP